MPIGNSAANIMFGVMAQLVGGQQVVTGLNQIGSAVDNTTRKANAAGNAATTMSNKMQVGAAKSSAAMQKAAQSSFRYTFYAMMAMRAGQALLSAVFVKGMAKAAEEYTHSMTRIQATLQATTEQMDKLRAKADEVVLKTPFGPSDTAEAMRNMAKQGLSVVEIQKMMLPAANMATMGEMSLTSGSEMLTEVLRAYRMEMDKADLATAQLGYTASQSKYELSDLKSMMEDVAPTAAGYGQSLDKTLQMITAFGRVGVKSEQAATMIRQVIMRASKPDVQSFFEWGLSQTGQKPLYDEEGHMRNVGEAMVAASKALDQLRQQAIQSGQGADFGAAVDSIIYKLFGVRQAKGFMALSGISLDQYKKYLENIKNNAEAYEKQYMETIKKDYHWAKVQAAASLQNLEKDLGAPMLKLLTPLKEVQAELTGFIDKLITSNETVRFLIPALLFLSGSIIGLAGSLSIAVGVTFLIRTRLADVGEELIKTGKAAARFGEQTIAGMSHAAIGFKYFKSFMIGPVDVLSALSISAGILYYAWKHNLAGLQAFLKPFFNWWQKTMINTNTLADQMMDKLRKAFKFPGATGHGGSPLGNIAYGIQQAADTVFGRLLGAFISGLKGVGTVLKYTVIPLLKIFGSTIYHSFYYLAWVLGTGNIERGFQRLGHAIGWLVGLKLFDTLVGKIKFLALGLYRLYGAVKAGSILEGGFISGYKLLRGASFSEIRMISKMAGEQLRTAKLTAGSIFAKLFKGFGHTVIPNTRAIMASILSEPVKMMRAAYAGQFVPKAYIPMRQAVIGTNGQLIPWLKGFGLAMYGRLRTGLVDPLIKAMLTGVTKIRWIVSGVEKVIAALRATMATTATILKEEGIRRAAGSLWRSIIGTAGAGGILGMLSRAGGGVSIGALFLGAGKYILLGLLAAGFIGAIVAAVKGAFGHRASPTSAPSSAAPSQLSSAYIPLTPAAWSPVLATPNGINITTYITAPAGTTKEQAEYMAAVIESKIREAAKLAQDLKTEHEQRREATKPDYWDAV